MMKVKPRSYNYYSGQCPEQLDLLIKVKPRSNNYSGQCTKQVDVLMWRSRQAMTRVLFVGQGITVFTMIEKDLGNSINIRNTEDAV